MSSVLAQPRRFCLLAYLVLAERPVARSTITALFWPESDEGNARNNLDQALFHLRKSLGKSAIESLEGGDLGVPDGLFTSDLGELLGGDEIPPEVRERAGEQVFGGWNAEDSQPLQEWIDGLRRRAEARAAELTKSEAEDATRDDPGSPTTASPPRRRSHVPWAAAIPLAAVILLIVFLTQRDRETSLALADPAEAAAIADSVAPPSILIVLPEIIGVDDRPTPPPSALMFQIAHAIGRSTTLDVQPLEAEDPAALGRSLQAIGEGQARYVRTVVTVGGSNVRINAAFVQSGVITEVLNEPEEYQDEDELMLELPGRIAARVAQMVVAGLPKVGLESAIVR